MQVVFESLSVILFVINKIIFPKQTFVVRKQNPLNYAIHMSQWSHKLGDVCDVNHISVKVAVLFESFRWAKKNGKLKSTAKRMTLIIEQLII